jgi:chromosome segregation ATPase
LTNEHDGLKQQIQDQQEQHEQNTILMNKINSRLPYLHGKMTTAGEERKWLQKDLDQLSALIAKKEHTISRLLIERNAAKSEFQLSQKGANDVSNEIHQFKDRIIGQIIAKDRELSNLQNEVVRLRIDRLNIFAQSEKLGRGLKQIVDELWAKDDLINQYEMQIARNNRDIEKRHSEIDRVDRQYDTLTFAQNGEEYGPLERQIRQIQSRITQSDQNAAEDQATFLKKQTELVSLTRACEDLDKLNTT